MSWPVNVKNIGLYRGDTKSLRFRFWNDAANTIPSDMTPLGTVWKAQVRETPDGPKLADLAVDASDAATGEIVVHVSVGVWATANLSLMVWDLEASDDATTPTSVTTVVRGTFLVTGDVTHA